MISTILSTLRSFRSEHFYVQLTSFDSSKIDNFNFKSLFLILEGVMFFYQNFFCFFFCWFQIWLTMYSDVGTRIHSIYQFSTHSNWMEEPFCKIKTIFFPHVIVERCVGKDLVGKDFESCLTRNVQVLN